MRTGICILCVTLLFTGSTALASGHGAKKPAAHGAAKKPEAGHGKKADAHGKKDAKKGGHGDSGHGAAAKEPPPPAAHVSDVEQILALIAGKERKHDPVSYVETDLGEFRVSHGDSSGEEILKLKFHIFGVLNGEDQAKFDLARAGREQRLRDAVLSVVHRARQEQLAEPSLDSLKEELVAAINRVLENGYVRDVAFSAFSIERS